MSRLHDFVLVPGQSSGMFMAPAMSFSSWAMGGVAGDWTSPSGSLAPPTPGQMLNVPSSVNPEESVKPKDGAAHRSHAN